MRPPPAHVWFECHIKDPKNCSREQRKFDAADEEIEFIKRSVMMSAKYPGNHEHHKDVNRETRTAFAIAEACPKILYRKQDCEQHQTNQRDNEQDVENLKCHAHLHRLHRARCIPWPHDVEKYDLALEGGCFNGDGQIRLIRIRAFPRCAGIAIERWHSR